MHARCRQREVHTSRDRFGLAPRLVPRRGKAIAVVLAPRLTRHRLDGHHAEVTRRADREKLLGSAAVTDIGPQPRVDGAPHGGEGAATEGPAARRTAAEA